MTRKKKSQTPLAAVNETIETSSTPVYPSGHPLPLPSKSAGKPTSANGPKPTNAKGVDHLGATLIICRNKHWKYISSYHGPWLQLPPEVLESLAFSNYATPRPRPIDPAVFFDLVKIRRFVEEATDLAVRAANGTTSSSLSNSKNASNGLMNSGSAVALGFGIGGASNAKLSRERKHRMREHATQKLSHAYHLDEIATSVATMQSASSLEEVAKLVLQRNDADSDAKYVHFFHEKIPSRALAQSTSLKALDEVIASRPNDGAPFRTRAITRMFKDDFAAAARDLTEGLGVHRLYTAQHKTNAGQGELANQGQKEEKARDWKYEAKVEEKDQPSSLEPQLLFHRAGVYLTIACRHINAALDGLKSKEDLNGGGADVENDPGHLDSEELAADQEAHRKRLEARKIVKMNAKRALRDYSAFLSCFDYTPGLPTEVTEDYLRKVHATANGCVKPHSANAHLDRPPGMCSHDLISTDIADNRNLHGDSLDPSTCPTLPPCEVYTVNALFAAIPPANLPPYPNNNAALVPKHSKHQTPTFSNTSSGAALLAAQDCHEAITYHPLLTDALHSLLLAHSLIQTSPTELLRHAHNVARLARVCDGYPIFLAARSPARADWIEVIRRTHNWLGLSSSWETLCAPAPLPGRQQEAWSSPPPSSPSSSSSRIGKDGSKKERHSRSEGISDGAEHEKSISRGRDNRFDQEKSGQRLDTAMTAAKLNQKSNTTPGPKRWAQEDGKEYPITTDRAEAIARWVWEAPTGSSEGGCGKSKKAGKRARAKKEADAATELRSDADPKSSSETVVVATTPSPSLGALEDSVSSLGLMSEMHESGMSEP